jgi:hypothetical protein
MEFQYPAKVIIAWGEAISGNAKIRDWLTKNGYPELGIFSFALRNQEEARNWLLENNHPHLMALINGAEGNPSAILWLRKYKFDILEKMALAADNSKEAMIWLINQDLQDMANVAERIQIVKNGIELDNNDVHKISSD